MLKFSCKDTFFDLPEDCVETALTYWKERKGIDFANCF